MDAQTLIANFGHFANAPDGMKRLREMILHFAVSGRLFPDSPSSNRAEGDIREAQALKSAYREKLKLRDTVSDQPITESDQYFPIPSYWQWTRLGNVASYIQRGKGPKYDSKGETVVVSQKCVQWSGFNLAVARTISDESVADYGDERFLIKGDLLWNSTGTGTAGRIMEFPGSKKKVVTDSHVTVIRLTNFIPAYVRCYIASPVIQQRMEPGVENTLVTGTTNQVELPTSKVAGLPIPCPTIEEQKRIVAKVDELMALCDRLEAQQQERQKLFPVVSQASHDRFAAAPNPADLDRIFDQIGNVSLNDLRKTVFSLAVQGKLVSQNPNDDSTITLLQAIQGTRKRLMAERAIPRRAFLDEPRNDEILFESPTNWVWTRFGDICLSSFYGPRFGKNEYVSDGIPTIRTTDMTVRGEIILRNPPRVKVADPKKLALYSVQKNDLLITRSGTIGMMAIFKDDYPAIPSAYLIRFRFPSLVCVEFVQVFLRSSFGESLLGLNQRSVGVPNVNATSINNFVVPFPPFAEQRRIVAKVDQLMAIIDTSEKKLKERDHLAETFAKALVASLTGTQIAERKVKMKAPKTELISNLQLGAKPKAKEHAPLATLLAKAKGELSAKSLWQESGLSIDAFYQQLKSELARGWVEPPEEAVMHEVEETPNRGGTTSDRIILGQ